MAYWYWRPLKTDWVLAQATSDKFVLPEKGMLSALMIRLQSTLAAEISNYNNPYPMQRITLRVLGNGTKEIVDLRGRQLQAMNFWDTGEMPLDLLNVLIGSVIPQYAFIPFGRYIGDPRYGLDLSRFAAGVEFEETNTFQSTKYTANSDKLTVWGLFRKDPEAGLFEGGYLKKRQILNKDAKTETQYPVKLPTRNKLRQINMFTEPDLDASTYLPKTGPFTNLNNFWLGVKSREEYIYDNLSASYFARLMHQMYHRRPHTRIWCGAKGAADRVIDTMIYERTLSHVTPCGSATAYITGVLNTTMWERCEIPLVFTDAGAATSCNCYLSSNGILYHGHFPLLMQDPLSGEEDWLDAKAMADVYIEVTEAASLGNWYIVLDELQKTYPS